MKYLLPLIFILSLCSCSVSKKTEKMVYGKWEISSIKNETMNETSEDLKTTVDQLLSGSYIEFKKDNTFQYKLLNRTETGIWNISEDGKLITIVNKPYYFQIMEMIENRLSVTQIKNESKVLLILEKIIE
jgi:hypothetical protein